MISLKSLRRYAVARSLFPPTTLKRAFDRFGFVQADPIRSPARAQDLILRHRVKDYREGDLERRYEKLGIHEDVFVNYGFVTSDLQALMHPRPPERNKRTALLLEFVRQHGPVHPRVVDEHFSHGTVTNYWGGSSNATTHLLDAMHYSGMLRVVRREAGIRIYAVHQHAVQPADAASRRARLDALADAAVNIYAPLPASSLAFLLRRLRLAAPQWRGELTQLLQRAKQRMAHARVDGVDWYWPASEDPARSVEPEEVRFLAPFDPVVWDRARFEMLWGWEYRFEAYTPVAKRKRGYYALPLLWRDRVIGWANVAASTELGFVGLRPKDPAFNRSLEAEHARLREFRSS